MVESGNVTKSANQCVELNDYMAEHFGDLSTEPFVVYLFAVLYSVVIAMGLLGNSCVIIAVLRNKSLQTVPNMFIFSLSCSDILVCCFSATITPITAFTKKWVFGYFLCKSVSFFMGITLCFSTFTLAAISVDRFLLIRYPLKKILTKNIALLIIMCNCLLAACFSAPVMVNTGLIDGSAMSDKVPICGQFCDETFWSEDERLVYGTVLLCVRFVAPFLIIFFCYASILNAVRKSAHAKVSQNATVYEWQSEVTPQQRAATKRRQRTNRMLISMVVAFAASWFENVLFHTLRDYNMLPEFFSRQEFVYAIIVHWIAMTSTIWNPLLYAVLNLQFREAFLELVPKYWFRRHRGNEAATPLTNFEIDGTARPMQKRTSRSVGKRASYGKNGDNYAFEESMWPSQ